MVEDTIPGEAGEAKQRYRQQYTFMLWRDPGTGLKKLVSILQMRKTY